MRTTIQKRLLYTWLALAEDIQNACWYSMQLMVRPVIFMGALLYMMIDRGTVMI